MLSRGCKQKSSTGEHPPPHALVIKPGTECIVAIVKGLCVQRAKVACALPKSMGSEIPSSKPFEKL